MITTIQQSTKPLVWEDFLGVNSHFLWLYDFATDPSNPQLFRDKVMARVNLLKQLGLTWTRIDLHWETLEAWGYEGEMEENIGPFEQLIAILDEQHIKTVVYFVGSAFWQSTTPCRWPHPSLCPNYEKYPPKDYNIFAERMAWLANRFRTVDAWQVWNEPNIIGYWAPYPNVTQYTDMLNKATAAIHAVAPNKLVISAGISQFGDISSPANNMIPQLINNGINTIIPYHPYTQLPEGEVATDDQHFTPYQDGQEFITRTQATNQLIEQANLPAIWTTEWGWSTYQTDKEVQNFITDQQQADYILRRLLLTAALGVDKTFLFDLFDLDTRATVRDRSYGLLNLNGSAKVAYHALHNLIRLTGPSLQPVALPTINQPSANLYIFAWQRTDNSKLLCFWSTDNFTFQLPTITSAELYDPLTDSTTVLANPQGISVATKPNLQIIIYS